MLNRKRKYFLLCFVLLMGIPERPLGSTRSIQEGSRHLILLPNRALCHLIQETEFAYLESEFCAIGDEW
jgi:hypothetical protein